MTLSKLYSVALFGLEALQVEVEVDVTKTAEKQSLVIVGLPDTCVRESKDRVLSAVKNSGYSIGCFYCTVNLAPGDLRKEGALYDLPVALGLLRSTGTLKIKEFDEYIIVGELGLSGEMRPMQGALAIAMLARQLGKKGLMLPSCCAKEAAAVPGIDIIPVSHFREAVQFFTGCHLIKPIPFEISDELFCAATASVDFADIKGQVHVKRAIEIAAAGGHNVVLSGPPGSGKTMLAKSFIGILPALSVDEALETTKIHSIAGLLKNGQSLVTERPFRSPHHTVSYAGLIGGGTNPRPGEVSLAHNGVLFLDELPEFSRPVLEVLRQPLEDRKVTISRANGSFTFPTNFICIAAMNPCPCGMRGHPQKQCTDSELQVTRYRNKISGPLWDRMDMHIEVPALRYQDMRQGSRGESSAEVRHRIIKARQFQKKRFGLNKTNSQISGQELKQHAPLDESCQELMRNAIDVMGISARSADRLIRLARTIADLAEMENILEEHMMEALSYRVSK